MGARIPPSERPRRGGIKCEFCGRAVPSEAALHSHQAALHSQALKERAKQKTVAKPKPEPKKDPLEPKKDSSEPKRDPALRKVTLKSTTTDDPIKTPDGNRTPNAPKKPQKDSPKSKTLSLKPKTNTKMNKVEKADMKAELPDKKADKEAKSTGNDSKPPKERNVDYQCPRCNKLFHVMFFAQKHIEKNRCSSNSKGKLAQDVQPIVRELCVYCNVKYSRPHECRNRPEPNLVSYNCTGCEQAFKSNKLFDMHVADVHGDQSESMFFLTDEEFVAWKDEMESQTECKYILMGKYNKKDIYRCSEYTDKNTEDTMLFCPSSIVSSKCAKGTQVYFYPSHYQHDSKNYELKDLYKTFSVTDLIQQASDDNLPSDDTDLYLQFKTLMETIVFDAAKININTLKVLYTRAQEMMSVLQEYDEDEEVEVTSDRSTLLVNTSRQSYSDDSINTIQTRTRKRGIEENGTVEKRQKVDESKVLIKSSVKKPTFSLADDKDSDKILKELGGENLKTNNESTEINKNCTRAVSKDETLVSAKPILKKINNDAALSPTATFVDTYKDFINKNHQVKGVKSIKESQKKKNIVKTKMGQFKPSLSPKKETKRTSIGKTTEFEYEVREQENDCNILVLKI